MCYNNSEVAGQNYGAGNLKRCNRVTWTAILLCNAATVPLSLAAFLKGKTLLGIFGVRLLWIYTAFPVYNSLEMLMFIYPVTQGIASLCHTGCYVYVRRKIRNG